MSTCSVLTTSGTSGGFGPLATERWTQPSGLTCLLRVREILSSALVCVYVVCEQSSSTLFPGLLLKPATLNSFFLHGAESCPSNFHWKNSSQCSYSLLYWYSFSVFCSSCFSDFLKLLIYKNVGLYILKSLLRCIIHLKFLLAVLNSESRPCPF